VVKVLGHCNRRSKSAVNQYSNTGSDSSRPADCERAVITDSFQFVVHNVLRYLASLCLDRTALATVAHSCDQSGLSCVLSLR